MAATEQEQQSQTKLRQVLAGLKNINPESLDRTAVLGTELSFKSGIPIFKRTLALFEELSECPLENAPAEVLNRLHDYAKQAWDALQAIEKFSIAQHAANPQAQRDALTNNVQSQWHNWYEHVTPHIAYSKARSTDYAQLEREARGTLSLMQGQLTELRGEKDKGVTEIQGALEQVRRAAAEAGVAQHAIHFKMESTSYEKEARVWLLASVGFGILTAAYAIYGIGSNLVSLGDGSTLPTILRAIIPRIVVLSVLTFGLVWTTRNYSACRHNLVVNRHRQNALSTFETFAKAAADPQTKDAVLIQATQSIFCSQPSGFVAGDVEGGGNHVVGIVRGMSGSKE